MGRRARCHHRRTHRRGGAGRCRHDLWHRSAHPRRRRTGSDPGPHPRPRGRRHGHRGRLVGAEARRRRPGTGVVRLVVRQLPVLPRRQLRAVPRRRRLDPRPPDRRHPGRVCAGPVRRQLHPQGS